jgi:hypothetical protein
MRIILFYAPSFWFKTYQKVLHEVPDVNVETHTESAVVVFYHAEAEDAEKVGRVVTKLVKNIKWQAGKFNTGTVVLHSFSHLSLSKAPSGLTEEIIAEARKRLAGTGFSVIETPFGYLNEWKIHVAGESLAKVYKEF